jgi:uncharacterized protein YjiS (DUF1127 family)
MVSGMTKRRVRGARYASRRASNSRGMELLARTGLVARGVMYMIIGLIALQIAFGHSGSQADRSGAVHLIAKTPFGSVALWLLVVGFIGMTLWRLSEAAYGAAGSGGHKASTRAAALARAVFYGFVAYGILKFALGVGSPSSSNQQSVDLTASAMRLPGGQLIVALIGLAFAAGGVYLAYSAWRKKFRKRLELGRMSTRTRLAVERLGQIGGIARGAVFATAGIFLVVAAARYQPQQAKGVDSSLRALASTPLGPWLLVIVALGLVVFGVYSLCEARWRRV